MHRLPWWVSGLLAMVAAAAVQPAIARFTGARFSALLTQHLGWLQVLAAAPFLLLAIANVYVSVQRGRALRPARNLDALARIDWSAFEELVAELFRRRGYHAFTTPAGADGGVDIIVESRDERAIVQAKHWPGRAVGAPVVREIYALLDDFDADRAIVATSGRFSAGALRFAEDKPLELLDGAALVAAARRTRHAVGSLQDGAQGASVARHNVQQAAVDVPCRTFTCPHCRALIEIPDA